MTPTLLLELACFSLESARIAATAGADRIELCEDYVSGGLTPSDELIRKLRKELMIPLHVMIRPRAGNFVYSAEELKKMEASILFCKGLAIEGVVFGCLNNSAEIDLEVCRQLIRVARPMSVTFHRAIDSCMDIKRALEELVQMGADRVLSSGRAASAQEGMAELTILQKHFGKKITIIPGGGLRSSNIKQLLATGCREYHSSAIVEGPEADAEEISSMKRVLTAAK